MPGAVCRCNTPPSLFTARDLEHWPRAGTFLSFTVGHSTTCARFGSSCRQLAACILIKRFSAKRVLETQTTRKIGLDIIVARLQSIGAKSRRNSGLEGTVKVNLVKRLWIVTQSESLSPWLFNLTARVIDTATTRGGIERLVRCNERSYARTASKVFSVSPGTNIWRTAPFTKYAKNGVSLCRQMISLFFVNSSNKSIRKTVVRRA
ncbi:MAG: hypothetical protein JWM87_4642 [Candidatus Eremiobacteraeota bacterium]|nr:hypothetical protein [Candidatus Eremiobacteraeota bacterium]